MLPGEWMSQWGTVTCVIMVISTQPIQDVQCPSSHIVTYARNRDTNKTRPSFLWCKYCMWTTRLVSVVLWQRTDDRVFSSQYLKFETKSVSLQLWIQVLNWTNIFYSADHHLKMYKPNFDALLYIVICIVYINMIHYIDSIGLFTYPA